MRELLFGQTEVTGLFCFENRKEIFEGVHRSYKFLVLTFEKGGRTKTFPAAFMRLDVGELEHFPNQGALPLSVDLIRRLSPDSLSVMEFKNEVDVRIAEKMLRFPFLGNKIEYKWEIALRREFHMTDDSYLFKTKPGPGWLPLYEGKMIHQFDHRFSEPRYWIAEEEGRASLLGRDSGTGRKLDYESYRLGYRAIARNTDQRTMIAVVLPPKVFSGHSINVAFGTLTVQDTLFVTAVFNSFVIDFSLRQRVSANLTIFYIYQLPIPRLTKQDSLFAPIVIRAARLSCTTPEFDELAQDVGLGNRVTDPTERAKLRAELDGLIAHLYGLTEEEFTHILTTFPLVPEPVKVAAQNAYRDVERRLIK